MAARKVNASSRNLVLAYIREHQDDYTNGLETKSDVVRRAFESVYLDAGVPVNLNSSTVARYWDLAVHPTHDNQATITTRQSPLDAIHAAERKIEEALKDLDAERNQLSNRIKEIDNTIAKYHKFLENGH